MANEEKTPKLRTYKLATGKPIRLPKLGVTITNDDLKNVKVVNMIQKEAPELFAQGVIVLA